MRVVAAPRTVRPSSTRSRPPEGNLIIPPMSSMKSQSRSTDHIRQAIVLGWMEELRASIREAEFGRLRHFDQDAVYTMRAWPRTVRRARRQGGLRAKRLAGFGNWRIPPFPRESARGLESAVRNTVLQFLPLVSESIANAHAALDA